MGLFDFWKKKPQEAASSKRIDQEIYRKIAELLTKDPTILSNLELCFASPQRYLDKYAERYDERGIGSQDSEATIVWLGLTDELLAGEQIIELDWQAELPDFLMSIKILADRYQLSLETDWFKEEDSIPVWCHTLDDKWAELGFCVGAMAIDSDSYVMFVCPSETLRKLMTLGQKINQRFDLAEKM
ncbi:DUF6630 family protein [Streptococcus orisratti]|uniref:DUF6630 family protein n=1 Tax=Streptococcus orisratti TaxID=114652 RepID=UPI000371C49D|nr:DUF6630 family protein [Streptococcus orisratti]